MWLVWDSIYEFSLFFMHSAPPKPIWLTMYFLSFAIDMDTWHISIDSSPINRLSDISSIICLVCGVKSNDVAKVSITIYHLCIRPKYICYLLFNINLEVMKERRIFTLLSEIHQQCTHFTLLQWLLPSSLKIVLVILSCIASSAYSTRFLGHIFKKFFRL